MRMNLSKSILILIAISYIVVIVLLPIFVIFTQALHEGMDHYWAVITNPMTLSALKRSCIVCACALCINIIMGMLLAWLITTYNFRGKILLNSLIDLPITISPIIVGTSFILLLGSQHSLGRFLIQYNLSPIFTLYGVILVSIFTTFPYITRQLIISMKNRNFAYEAAAATLGANNLQIFFYILLPTIKDGLLYAISLCAARIVGEYGAVMIISGHIIGHTDTIPLYIDSLYNSYDLTGAFAVSTMMLPICFLPVLFTRSTRRKVS